MQRKERKRVIHGAVITMLTVETISDIRTKTISVIRLIIYLVLAIIINLISSYQPVWSMIGGMAIGLVMLLYAKLSHEGIGYGDAAIFLVVGAFIGISDNIKLLFFSLIAASIGAVLSVIIRKNGLRSQIPFIPFVLGTYLVLTILEVYACHV